MKNYPLWQKAKELLQAQYYEAYQIVKDSSYHKAFVGEKIKHSLQVSGAGNGILAHEPYFQDKPEEFIDIARTAIVLHDIYRFKEVVGWFKNNEKIDHGIKGAEFLQKIKDFNDIRITLPIKHHGHMIEELYNDPTFQNLDEKTKQEIKHIAFAVRDADKIANWQLLAKDWDNMREVWLPEPNAFSDSQGKINQDLWQFFLRCEVSPNNLRSTNADAAISIMCWLFDINYDYSIFYCQKLKLFDAWRTILEKLKVDNTQIDIAFEVMRRFTAQKFKVQI